MGDSPPVAQPEVVYCANHPTVETLLRCSKCGKPICQRCGIRTPVGIRCRECAQMRRLPMYKVGLQHYLLAALVALPASFVAGLFMNQMGWFLALIAGAAVGGFVGEIVYRITHKRGTGLAILVCGCILLGAVASSWLILIPVLLAVPAEAMAGVTLPGVLGSLNVVYVVLAIGAAFARLR